MNRTARIALSAALALATLSLTALPASATECTPKGCTGGCRITISDWHIDESGNVVISSPIECTS